MQQKNLEVIVPDWPAPKNIYACTTTRLGGFSRTPFDSFNLAAHVDDGEESVTRNRQKLNSALHLPREPAWLSQTHSTIVVKAKAQDWQTIEADASWSDQKGVVCAVLTADCLPVLITDKTGSFIAAVHAGWRGLVNGILEATIASLPTTPEQLLVWLGPAIGPQAFEIGSEVREAFIKKDPRAKDAFMPKTNATDKWLGDLYLLARQKLSRAGITSISGGGLCTYTDATRFYSYRRDQQTGRMATLIWAN